MKRTSKTRKPATPGEILEKEFMKPLGLGPHAVACALGCTFLEDLCNVLYGGRVDAEMAIRLGRYFRTSPELWLNLQNAVDLYEAEKEAGARIRREVKPLNRRRLAARMKALVAKKPRAKRTATVVIQERSFYHNHGMKRAIERELGAAIKR